MADVVIVGAGLVGLLTACELARAGCSVTLLERGEPAREASWAAGGMLVPLHPWRVPGPLAPLLRWCESDYPELAARLTASTGIDPEWTRSGLLILDSPETEQALAWAAQSGVRMERLDAADVAAIEPMAPAVPALWLPDAAQVRNPRLAKAALAAAKAAGVDIRTQEPVLGLALREGWIRGVHLRGGLLESDAVVLAAGAWTAELLRDCGGLPSRPVRGQMLLLRSPGSRLERMLLREGRYLIPRRDGLILCGSTMEDVGFDTGTTSQALDELRAAAAGLAPGLAPLTVEQHWAGLRPGSPEGLPYIGPHPEIAGLYVNAGHFRHGILLANGSARLLADLILDREPIVSPDPFRLAGRLGGPGEGWESGGPGGILGRHA